jgi:hypothetical protein
MQDKGVGKALLSGCEDYLARSGCTHFGLETMPYIMKNVHFYLHAGYRPQQFTCIMEKRLSKQQEAPNGIDQVEEHNLGTVLPEISALSRLYHQDLDLSREVEMVVREGLGALFVSRSDERLIGFGVLHAFHPIEESDHSAVRLLLVDPHRANAADHFDRLMHSMENQSLLLGRSRMFVRFTVTPLLYEEMRRRDYVLQGSNMRMIKGPGYSEKEGFIMASWAG